MVCEIRGAASSNTSGATSRAGAGSASRVGVDSPDPGIDGSATGPPSRCLPSPAAEQPPGQRGDDEPRDGERDAQAGRHRERKRREERAGDARRANAGGMWITIVEADDPASGRENSSAASTTALGASASAPRCPPSKPPDDVLDHHDRVVDDQPHRGGHTAERHHVEAHAPARRAPAPSPPARSGTASVAISVIASCAGTRAARAPPVRRRTASPRPPRQAEERINSLWSYQLVMCTPFGSGAFQLREARADVAGDLRRSCRRAAGRPAGARRRAPSAGARVRTAARRRRRTVATSATPHDAVPRRAPRSSASPPDVGSLELRVGDDQRPACSGPPPARRR